MSANAETDKKSGAARLVGMAQEKYLLRVSEDGELFGADRTRPHLAMLLRAGKAGLRAELASRYFSDTGTVVGGQALTDATLILEGLAANQPPGEVAPTRRRPPRHGLYRHRTTRRQSHLHRPAPVGGHRYRPGAVSTYQADRSDAPAAFNR